MSTVEQRIAELEKRAEAQSRRLAELEEAQEMEMMEE